MKIADRLAIPTLAVLFLLASGASAQTFVTPTVAPTPPGNLITVNNGPGDHLDPHVSGDLVSYSNSDGINFTIRYFNLVTRVDAGVPNSGTFDFLADVRGSVIVFTRVSASSSSIFAFDTANPSMPPVEIAPQPGSSRQSAQIGDQTIAWQQFTSASASAIVAYNRATATTQVVTPSAISGSLNEAPGISPDGTVVVWKSCATILSPCSTWKATLSNGTWTAQQVVSQLQPGTLFLSVGATDTDGTIIAYTGLNSQQISQLAWQPVAGGTEQVLSWGGQGSFPSVSGGLIAFAGLKAGATTHDIYVYNVAANTLYNITGGLVSGDNELNDISVTADGKVRVVWQVQTAHLSIFAYTFNLPVTTSSISNLIGALLAAGCIDNSGIGTALTSKLADAQAAISAGNIQTAINTLTALKNQINAQAGKHIATSCSLGGVAINPVTALLTDVQSLIDSLGASMVSNPITGFVVNSSGAGVAGATLSILDAAGHTVATAASDITGFYFFATTGVLVPGSSYTVAVTGLPAGFVTTPPPSPAFTWAGAGMMIGNFVLN